ncbi:hypothetical protein [Phytohabitans kaempferiae]|uniref:IraD/Gp25-like domain-containing protein n=1 Tax=Phytohabitans kaempferiae TaxID=1620943 RepID=A0ABV6MG16_9ACTN
MTTAEQRLGTDLALTRLFVADEWGAHDLTAEPSRRGRRVVAATVPSTSDATDLATLTGRQNLAQALILRLLTPLGALADLGHPAYGSRLGELVGRANDPTARFLARRYVLEAVAQEARAEVVDLVFDDPAGERPDTVGFTLVVRPVTGGDPIGLSVGVEL